MDSPDHLGGYTLSTFLNKTTALFAPGAGPQTCVWAREHSGRR